MTVPRWGPAALALALTLALGACGSADGNQNVAPEPTATPSPEPTAAESAPTDSAPPGCQPDGREYRLSPTDAAMGLRALSVTLTNCGPSAFTVNGYPAARVLDADGEPLDVTVGQGPGPVTALPDPGPRRLTLRPGESATATVVWRNTYNDLSRPPLTGTWLEVAQHPGAPAVKLRPDGPVDLGSSGRLGTTAWSPAER
ncbi:DUF4232 domain-containing protein [Streptomyces alkaliterrae]|uniref:DUF4232 domain-containing protein n=1 Tax=Streptomyces alkaliterrae TaxID=2213162 RepID=A0A5P0YUX2_9ACTN|nr:DUF4232 domain-containing protein [Streptomyces alkaliterrae]MBB1259970.1 DUF4232 domain-containing protein [Streptomyces alkaliterrae]MQS03407.1 DUF4232 domain-containing protein [Streptomyces alkaliterrae]